MRISQATHWKQEASKVKRERVGENKNMRNEALAMLRLDNDDVFGDGDES